MFNINRRKFIQIGSIFSLELPFLRMSEDPPDFAGIKGLDAETSAEHLFKTFKQQGRKYKPFVRWWWNGDRVEIEEIKRELDILKNAGIGGVEINPIRFPGDTDALRKNTLLYLSDEWISVLQATLKEAKKREITCDMIVGSGWPYGGEFLDREDQIKMMALGTKSLEGGKRYQFTREALLDEVNPPIMSPHHNKLKELVSIKLIPHNFTNLSECKDFSIQADQDEITVEVPQGKFELYFLVRLTGYMAVINGAPGASGPVLDHYNKQAVERYLKRISDKLTEKIGPLGNYFRAFFTDSLELEGANWCEDMFAEFQKRKKYDLAPYFPFILFKTGHMGDAINEQYGAEFSAEMKDKIERVRYDFESVRVELFRERFIGTFIDWCRQNGVKSRMQAYGRPCNPLEASMDLDIPECETWLGNGAGKVFSDKDYRRGRAYSMINKYVSSAAHLSGRQVISCEEMTNTGMVFNASLETLKIAGDQSIISGVTHSVLHGFNYSPLEAPFPGWVRYGTFFNERNTWWKFFNHWVGYKTRLYSVLQQSEMQADIAILPPLADLSGKFGFQRDPFPAFAYPAYLFQIWEAVHQCGNGCDYVTEKIIQHARIGHESLIYGNRKYKAILLVDTESLLPETVNALNAFKAQGGKLIFIEHPPHRNPELNNTATEKSKSAVGIKKLVSVRREIVPAPDGDLKTWYRNIQEKFSLQPYVQIDTPDKFLSQVYYKHGDLDIFFFSNYNAGQQHTFNAKFNLKGKKPWLWDPETGDRFIYPTQHGADNELLIKLRPAESKLIVFDKPGKGEAYKIPSFGKQDTVRIDGPWNITLQPVSGKERSFSLDQLIDFSKEAALKSFGGVIHYTCDFNLRDPSKIQYLDLGRIYGIAEVVLNDKKVGLSWYGTPLFDISKMVKEGKNTIGIKVTTTLGNYVKSLYKNKVAQNWTRNQPYHSMGLIGPTLLY